MIALDTISLFSDLLSIYEFVLSRNKDDYSSFCRQVKKTVKVVSQSFRESLEKSVEFKNIIPHDFENVVFEALLSAFKEQRSFRIGDLVGVSLPENVLNAFEQALLESLQKSFAYAQVDFQNWARQSDSKIQNELQNIISKLSVISEYQASALRSDFSNLPVRNNRFHCTSNRTGFFGRQSELSQLMDFCCKNPLGSGTPSKLQWWIITGPAGSGKSRLSLEFAKLIALRNWKVCFPPDHRAESLYQCSSRIDANTLFILDYAEYDTSNIGSWISFLGRDQSIKYNIRVILIMRNVVDIDYLEYSLSKSCFSCNDVFDYAYDKHKPLFLSPLQRDDTSAIIKNFASSCGVTLLPIQIDYIFKVLLNIDGTLQRPLYAEILTDAYIDDTVAIMNWDREDALEYICNKEERILTALISEVCLGDQYLVDIAIEMLVFATMTGDIAYENDLQYLLPKEYSYILGLAPTVRRHFLSIDLLFSNCNNLHYIAAMKPDIIGEFFVLRFLERCDTRDIYLNLAWQRPYNMSRFINKLYLDYSDILERINLSFKKIVLPESIKKMDARAFENCIVLEEIILPSFMEEIGSLSFRNCINLRKITLPERVLLVGQNIFYNCSQLTNISIPDSWTRIDAGAFASCTGLQQISIPDGITEIGQDAFMGCIGLKHVTIPKSVKSISNNLFRGCILLEEMPIHDEIESIGNTAFKNCESLTFAHIPKSVLSIGAAAFSGCSKLTSVVVEGEIRALSICMFEDCTMLNQVRLPQSIVFISNKAFEGCNSLQFIWIGYTKLYRKDKVVVFS